MLSEKRRLVYRKKTFADTLAANRQQLVRKIVCSDRINRNKQVKTFNKEQLLDYRWLMAAPSLSSRIVTRRLVERPSAVLLLATGKRSP